MSLTDHTTHHSRSHLQSLSPRLPYHFLKTKTMSQMGLSPPHTLPASDASQGVRCMQDAPLSSPGDWWPQWWQVAGLPAPLRPPGTFYSHWRRVLCHGSQLPYGLAGPQTAQLCIMPVLPHLVPPWLVCMCCNVGQPHSQFPGKEHAPGNAAVLYAG